MKRGIKQAGVTGLKSEGCSQQKRFAKIMEFLLPVLKTTKSNNFQTNSYPGNSGLLYIESIFYATCHLIPQRASANQTGSSWAARSSSSLLVYPSGRMFYCAVPVSRLMKIKKRNTCLCCNCRVNKLNSLGGGGFKFQTGLFCMLCHLPAILKALLRSCIQHSRCDITKLSEQIKCVFTLN